MYRNLFVAWYCLGVLALAFATFVVLMPFIGADRAVGGFGFLGLLGFLPIFTGTRFRFFQKEQYDERDISFLHRALFNGFCGGFAINFAITGPMIVVCQFIYETDFISLKFLWFQQHCGLVFGIVMFATTLLLLYYRGEQFDTWKAG